jgi:hypothetical protein
MKQNKISRIEMKEKIDPSKRFDERETGIY